MCIKWYCKQGTINLWSIAILVVATCDVRHATWVITTQRKKERESKCVFIEWNRWVNDDSMSDRERVCAYYCFDIRLEIISFAPSTYLKSGQAIQSIRIKKESLLYDNQRVSTFIISGSNFQPISSASLYILLSIHHMMIWWSPQPLKHWIKLS